MSNIEPAIVFLDGHCRLCNGSAEFIARRDRAGLIRFATLQSESARRWLRSEPASPAESMVVVIGNRQLHASDAWLAILRRLSAPWCWLSVFAVLPRVLRDAVYHFIGRRRYRWFGHQTECRITGSTVRTRLLDGADEESGVRKSRD